MKEAIPTLEPDDLPDIRTLSEAELARVPADPYNWECCVEGCTRHTKAKYYGNWPWIHWRKAWVNVYRTVFYCSVHWKLYRKKVALNSSIKAKRP